MLRYLRIRSGFVSGAVVSASWLVTKMKVPWWKVDLSKVLNRIAPSVWMPVRLPPETLMRDPERHRAYLEDPMVH